MTMKPLTTFAVHAVHREAVDATDLRAAEAPIDMLDSAELDETRLRNLASPVGASSYARTHLRALIDLLAAEHAVNTARLEAQRKALQSVGEYAIARRRELREGR